MHVIKHIDEALLTSWLSQYHTAEFTFRLPLVIGISSFHCVVGAVDAVAGSSRGPGQGKHLKCLIIENFRIYRFRQRALVDS